MSEYRPNVCAHFGYARVCHPDVPLQEGCYTSAEVDKKAEHCLECPNFSKEKLPSEKTERYWWEKKKVPWN